MACLTIPDNPNTGVGVQASNCSNIATPDSWSFNLVDDGSSYMIQYLQHGSYMVNDVVVFGPSVVGVATIENTGYLWKVQPSNASYGHVIFAVPTNASSTDVTQSLTYDGVISRVILEDYTGDRFQDWSLQNSTDFINLNY